MSSSVSESSKLVSSSSSESFILESSELVTATGSAVSLSEALAVLALITGFSLEWLLTRDKPANATIKAKIIVRISIIRCLFSIISPPH